MTTNSSVKCPRCGRIFKERGINIHLYHCSKSNGAKLDANENLNDNDEIKETNKLKLNSLSFKKAFAFIVFAVAIEFLVVLSFLVFQNTLPYIKVDYLFVFVTLLLIGFVFSMVAATFGRDREDFGSKKWWGKVFKVNINDLRIEILGAAITFIFLGIAIDVAIEKENDYHRQRFLEKQLLSSSEQSVRAAVEELSFMNWLYDGTFENAQLPNAILSGYELGYANFRDSNMSNADLTRSVLSNANFEDAYLYGVNACAANFQFANLRNANFEHANLSYSNLNAADLRGANLFNADIKGANFLYAVFDSRTTLPDGGKWYEDINIEQYTGGWIALDENQIPYFCDKK